MNKKEPLLRLTEDGQRLVGLKFLKGETSLTEGDLGEYLEPIPGDPTADLSRIDDTVDRIIDEYPE